MKTTFTKANLMTGDMIICRNGKAATIMLNTVAGNIARFHTDKDSFSYIDVRYNDDLTHTKHENMDIVKVYRADPTRVSESDIGDLIANPDKMREYGKVIFDREESDDTEEETTAAEKPTLDSLMTGDMLVHNNGKVSTVYKDTPFGNVIRFHTEKDSFFYLRRFNQQLEHEKRADYNVVGVFRANTADSTTVGDLIGNPGKMLSPENLVWSNGSIAASYYHKGEEGSCVIAREGSEEVPGAEELSDLLNRFFNGEINLEDTIDSLTTLWEGI